MCCRYNIRSDTNKRLEHECRRRITAKCKLQQYHGPEELRPAEMSGANGPDAAPVPA